MFERALFAAYAYTVDLSEGHSEVDVPRSIQGLIAARLDALPGEEKAALQDAAVASI